MAKNSKKLRPSTVSTFGELNITNNHMGLKIDPSPVQLSDETPALVDIVIEVL